MKAVILLPEANGELTSGTEANKFTVKLQRANVHCEGIKKQPEQHGG